MLLCLVWWGKLNKESIGSSQFSLSGTLGHPGTHEGGLPKHPPTLNTLTVHPSSLLFSWLQPQQHPEIRPHNRIKGRNVHSAACQEISYIACTLGEMLIILEPDEEFCLSWILPPAASVNSLEVQRNNKAHWFYFQNHPIIRLCIMCFGPLQKCTIKCCGQLESRKRNSCCVSVCLWNRQMRAVISHCSSDMSQCPTDWERKNADTTGKQLLYQIITISRAGGKLVLCATVKLMIDDTLVSEWFYSG